MHVQIFIQSMCIWTYEGDVGSDIILLYAIIMVSPIKYNLLAGGSLQTQIKRISSSFTIVIVTSRDGLAALAAETAKSDDGHSNVVYIHYSIQSLASSGVWYALCGFLWQRMQYIGMLSYELGVVLIFK